MIQLDFSGMIKAIKEWAISKIPTKTSQLNNDSGFPVSSDVIDTYEELSANTQSGKFAGALGVNEGFTDVNGKLTNENNETFNFGIKDGVRGFFTDSSRADDSFVPFISTQVEEVTVEGVQLGAYGKKTYEITTNFPNGILGLQKVVANGNEVVSSNSQVATLTGIDGNNAKVTILRLASTAASSKSVWVFHIIGY